MPDDQPNDDPDDIDVTDNPSHFKALWMYAKLIKYIERGNTEARNPSKEAQERADDNYEMSARWSKKHAELLDVLDRLGVRMTDQQLLTCISFHAVHGEAVQLMTRLAGEAAARQN